MSAHSSSKEAFSFFLGRAQAARQTDRQTDGAADRRRRIRAANTHRQKFSRVELTLDADG